MLHAADPRDPAAPKRADPRAAEITNLWSTSDNSSF